MRIAVGEKVSGLVVDGRELRAGVVDENQVRAAAGVTLVLAAVAFSFSYFDKQYVPLQVISPFFLVDFLIRTTVGLRCSPVGVVAGWLTRWRPADWVSVKPKLFAWRLGVAIALAVTIISNSGIRGMLPRTLCATCLVLMWMEASLGLCLGCKIYAFLMRRGWTRTDPEIEVCAGGVCSLPTRSTAPAA